MLAPSFISTSGDRLHQMALAALILGLTDSMVSAGFVFAAAGTLLGLVLLPRLARVLNAGRVILFGCATMGLAVAVAGTTSSLLIVVLLAAVCGLGNILLIVPSVTMVQQQTPTALQGRVFAVRLMLALGCGMLLLAVCASFARSAREAV